MSLTNIGSAIDKNNPKEFVDAYLLCVAQGFSINCPVDKKVQDLNKKWSKILAKYRRDFTDEFCNEVSKIWFNLLEQCKTEAPNIELQLCNAAGISIETVSNATEAEKKTSLSDIPEKVSSDEGLTSAISERYRERQQAESISLPELTRLEAIRKKAFLSKDSAAFLIAHLTFAKHDQFQEIPKSSVPQNIRSGWEGIIADLFNTIASDSFLESLTNDWFYLVNQKGIPTKVEEQQEILITFLAKAKRDSTNQSKTAKNTSLFKRLFSK